WQLDAIDGAVWSMLDNAQHSLTLPIIEAKSIGTKKNLSNFRHDLPAHALQADFSLRSQQLNHAASLLVPANWLSNSSQRLPPAVTLKFFSTHRRPALPMRRRSAGSARSNPIVSTHSVVDDARKPVSPWRTRSV